MRIRVYALAIGVGAILLSAAVARAQQPAGVTARNSTTPQEPKESNSSNLPTAAAYSRPTPKEKWGHFVHEAIGPYTIVKTLAVAGVLDAENSPPDWGQPARPESPETIRSTRSESRPQRPPCWSAVYPPK